MTLTYQRFRAVFLLIYGSLFLSGICYCLSVFRCAAARMSELELEQRTNIKFLVKLGKKWKRNQRDVSASSHARKVSITLFMESKYTSPSKSASSIQCVWNSGTLRQLRKSMFTKILGELHLPSSGRMNLAVVPRHR